MTRRALAALMLVGLLVGCGSDSTAAECMGSGAVRACRTTKAGSSEVSGSGFRPGSTVHLSSDEGLALDTAVDDDGAFPRKGGVLGVLGVGSSLPIKVSGEGADGTSVTITLGG